MSKCRTANLDGSIADYQKYFLDSAQKIVALNADVSTEHVVGIVLGETAVVVAAEVNDTGSDKVSIMHARWGVEQ
jgi:hypothetical protein